jgi:hypothetical protein
MATLNIELYEALKEANLSDAAAKAAAVAIAPSRHRHRRAPVRVGKVEGDIAVIKGDIGTLKNDVQALKSDMLSLKRMIGFNLAASTSLCLSVCSGR